MENSNILTKYVSTLKGNITVNTAAVMTNGVIYSKKDDLDNG